MGLNELHLYRMQMTIIDGILLSIGMGMAAQFGSVLEYDMLHPAIK